MKISEKWFSKKLMCGYCEFGCCNSQSFHVEFSSNEIKYLEKKYNKSLKKIEYQNGKCRHLKDDNLGCCFGNDRPTYCKTYPITENKSNTLVVSNWSWLHCPKPTDYELVKIVEGKYHYRLKSRHKNKRDKLILDDDINKVIPTFSERFNGTEFSYGK